MTAQQNAHWSSGGTKKGSETLTFSEKVKGPWGRENNVGRKKKTSPTGTSQKGPGRTIEKPESKLGRSK